jgi:RNase P subunit RPR2
VKDRKPSSCEHCARDLSRGGRREVRVVDKRSREERTLRLCEGCATKPGVTWRLRFREAPEVAA